MVLTESYRFSKHNMVIRQMYFVDCIFFKLKSYFWSFPPTKYCCKIYNEPDKRRICRICHSSLNQELNWTASIKKNCFDRNRCKLSLTKLELLISILIKNEMQPNGCFLFRFNGFKGRICCHSWRHFTCRLGGKWRVKEQGFALLLWETLCKWRQTVLTCPLFVTTQELIS